MMNALSRFVTISVLALATTALAGAEPTINGSLALAGIGTAENGSDLSASTLLSTAFDITTGVGVGDFFPVPVDTTFSATGLDLTNFATFVLGNATYGDFDAASGTILTQTPDFLDVFLLGTFTANSGLGTFAPTDTSLRISINQSGTSLSEAITLNSPAIPTPGTPEPGTMLLLGSALLGIGVFRKKFAGRN
jgi:hypothetical protein